MEFERQIGALERGKQIGYRVMKDELLLECGIQKKDDSSYFVYFFKHDFEKDDYDLSKQEFYVYSKFEDAAANIISRNFPFDEFKPQKGNKIFDINDPRFPNQNNEN